MPIIWGSSTKDAAEVKVLGQGTRGGRQAEPEKPLGLGLSRIGELRLSWGHTGCPRAMGGARTLCVLGSGLGPPHTPSGGLGEPRSQRPGAPQE